MTLRFANNAGSTLSVTANLSDTVLTLALNEGARFPSPGAGESFMATIQSGAQFEIVECTSRTGDALTVVRAREGTSAQTWSTGSSVTMRVTAGTLDAMEQRTRALAEFAAINGPISLSADPSDGTHAVRESFLAARELAIRNDLGGDITARGALVGEVKEFTGINLPSRYVWAAGQALDRGDYAELFAATTREITVTAASGSPTITVTAGSLDGLSPGMPVSLPTYFASGVTIVSVGVGTLTLSANALASDSDIIAHVCPHGVGNNTTTFNVADRRGRVAVGRDDMNNSAANRLTSGVAGFTATRLGAGGGDEHLHTHGHGVSQTPHGHGVTDPGHWHTNTGGNLVFYNQNGPPVAYQYPNSSSGNYFALGGITVLANSTGVSIQGANANITIQANGAGGAQNVQPSIVCNHIIFTNVP